MRKLLPAEAKDQILFPVVIAIMVRGLAEPDFTKYNMFLDQHLCSNQPIRFERRVYSLSSFGSQPGLDQNKTLAMKEGESVTLDPCVIKNPKDLMTWYFNDTLIAEITGDQSKICTDDQCKERFRDRLKLDHQTGSLTITNIRNTDSGDYKLQINSSRISIIRSFSVSVTDSHVETAALNRRVRGKAVFYTVTLLLLAVAVAVIDCLCRDCKQKRQKYETKSVLVMEGESEIMEK